MFIKSIVLIIVAIGITFWLLRRWHVQHLSISEPDTEVKGDQGVSQDELDDSQAAEVVATWNLLNPP